MAVLSLFLLFAQAVEQNHSHDDGLQAQYDCEICLKVGSLEDLAVAETASLSQQPTTHTFSDSIESLSSNTPLRATARAPPAYI